MDERHHRSAGRARAAIADGHHDAAAFRAALLDVPARVRDAWLDLVLGLDELPDDAPLPPGCVPYLPCPVDALVRVVDEAGVGASDVFVDLGAGVGRAVALVHLLTGATAIGVELQPALVVAARALAARLRLSRVSCLEGDAADVLVDGGSVFFLYCPFGGARLGTVLDRLEPIARVRPLRVCCVDLPLPPRPWLTPDPPRAGDLAVYRSNSMA